MELNHQVPTAPPRPAATVVMLRDAPEGMEVFMIKRHGLSDVMGGAYVFPGGKVDRADAEQEALMRLDSPVARLHERLGDAQLDPFTAAGYFVAACRETFEESGVLLVEGATGAMAQQAQTWAREGASFIDILAELDVRLNCAAISPWSRWITPVIPSLSTKRFDTRFFVAAVPPDQQARHDDHEGTESAWMRPRAALEQFWARDINLAPPQIMSLAHLTRFASVRDVLEACVGRQPPVIQPHPLQVDGLRVVTYPGDADHPIGTPALPGPSRLVFRDGRFEPSEGFEAFFR